MKNKEFKKGIAIGVAATLVVTGAVFTMPTESTVSKRQCAFRCENGSEAELPGRTDR